MSQQPDGRGVCNLLPSSNSSFLIAQHWENIPETFILNGSIGLILYIVFLAMTRYAWNQTYNDQSDMSQGLLSYLYGYRDPERWFLIPRYEFLRQSSSHHKHDHTQTSIYVPPKLALANPVEMLAQDLRDDHSNSSEEPQTHKISLVSQQQPPASLVPSIKDSNVFRKTDNPQETKSKKSNGSIESKHSPKAANPTAEPTTNESRGLALSDSFFYPSILTAEQLQASYISRKLNRIFSSFFKVTDADIIYAKGIDAYEYLLFQRHLILVMFVTNVLCIGVILPIHWLGSNTDVSSFQRSTIKNMSADSILYWAHIFCSIVIVSAAVIILNSYRESTLTKKEPQLSRRTVLIGNISPMYRSRPKLFEIMRSCFLDTNIEAIQFVYDTKLLERYQLYLSSLIVAKNYCIYYKDRYGRELMVKPTDVNEQQYCDGNCRLCSFIYVCSCRWPNESKRPGIEYYSEQESRYRKLIETLFKTMIVNPSEYAFVTFKSNRQARRVIEELTKMKSDAGRFRGVDGQLNARQNRKSLNSKFTSPDGVKNTSPSTVRSPKRVDTGSKFSQVASSKGSPSSVSSFGRSGSALNEVKSKDKESTNGKEKNEDEVDPLIWSIRYAPQPDNVEYYDLLNLAITKKYTIVLLHALMVVIFIFITTPNVILSILDKLYVFRPSHEGMGTYQTLVINYISILLQIITTALLPSLITLISKQIPYEDTASKNHSIMWKVYLFLVLMVIVMPSIGMSSAQALFSSDINPKCLFPTDNGAYFVNYVLTTVCLSTVMELIKPTDIVFYCFILWTGRSVADFEGGRQFIEREFSVGMQHTNVLLIFAVVMTYAMSCPLIAPVGLLYLIVKHAVDHYHLFYVYFTKKVDKNLQTTIVVFVRVALLLMLFQTTVAISLNTGTSYFSFTSQILFCITLAMFTCNFFLYCTSQANNAPRKSRFQRDFCACFYLPRAIEDLLRLSAVPVSLISRTKQ